MIPCAMNFGSRSNSLGRAHAKTGMRAANDKTKPIFVRRRTKEKIFARGGQHKPLKRLNPAKAIKRNPKPFSWLSLAPLLPVFAQTWLNLARGLCEAAGAPYARTCPSPRTRYLKVHSCSTPTGPRACMRPVAMPISAPKPNSPPSANWVEALWMTIAEVDLLQEPLGGGLVLGDDAIGMMRAVGLDVVDRRLEAVDDAHGNDRVEIFGPPVLFARRSHSSVRLLRLLVAAHRAARLDQRLDQAPEHAGAAARCTSSVSAAPQTPVRRILALTASLSALSRSAARST